MTRRDNPLNFPLSQASGSSNTPAETLSGLLIMSEPAFPPLPARGLTLVDASKFVASLQELRRIEFNLRPFSLAVRARLQALSAKGMADACF
jgi:hypothetical protein